MLVPEVIFLNRKQLCKLTITYIRPKLINSYLDLTHRLSLFSILIAFQLLFLTNKRHLLHNNGQTILISVQINRQLRSIDVFYVCIYIIYQICFSPEVKVFIFSVQSVKSLHNLLTLFSNALSFHHHFERKTDVTNSHSHV